MNILLAPDSFKDALPSSKICHFLEQGINESMPHAKCIKLPLADGGEGTLEVIGKSIHGQKIYLTVEDALGRPIDTYYLYDVQSKTAYIETALASGLENLNLIERNPLRTSTFGTGQTIKDGILKGAKTIVLFVGGTATNDGGIGIAKALGYNLLDKNGVDLRPVGGNLLKINKIIKSNLTQDLGRTSFVIASDVNNLLLGKDGATYTFGPQKGADNDSVFILERGLKNLSEIYRKDYNVEIDNLHGMGAGGGIPVSLFALFNAKIVSASNYLLDLLQFDEIAKKCDFVISGEGAIDKTTLSGKLVSEVLKRSNKYNLKSILVCGTFDDSFIKEKVKGVVLIESINVNNLPKAQSIEMTPDLLLKEGMRIGQMISNGLI